MSKYLCLSFDDGPSNDLTMPKMLDILEKYNTKASFFIIGSKVNSSNKKDLERALSLGCDIQNHSWTHPNMSEMTKEDILDEYNKTDAIIKELTGKPAEFFRPPYLAVSETLFNTIKVPIIFGKSDLKDWDASSTAQFRKEKLIEAAEDGAIYLLHVSEGNDASLEALDEKIPELLNMGYEFVTISEIFKKKNVNPNVPNFPWLVAK